LRNELEAIGVKLDMNVLKKYLQAVKKEANDKIKSQEEAIRKEWEKNPPRIPTLFKNFYNYDAKPQYYHNIEEHNNQFLMNTKATLYDIMYPDIRDKNFIYKINKKNDCVYSAKTKPQKDSFMWQGIQTCFEKQSLVQFENLILSSSTISGELKRGGNTFILHGHFDKLFSDVQRKEHITHAWQQINNDAKSFGTAKNSKEMAKAAHEMGNHQNPMFDEMYNMFGDKDIDSFVRLVGESKDCDYRIAIQGIINKNFEFEALLRKIDDNEDAVTPEQS